MLRRSFKILIDVVEKQKSISNSNVNFVRINQKLRLKVWHKAINISIKYYWVGYQSGKDEVELLPPSRDVQRRAILLIGRPIKCRPRVERSSFLLLPDDYATRPLVRHFCWLANWSHVFRNLDRHKRRPRKGNRSDRRLVPYPKDSTPLPPLCHPVSWTWPFLPKLINSKTDLRLIIIASQLITSNFETETSFVVVHDFNQSIMNKGFIICTC